jgi:hypothetical protein
MRVQRINLRDRAMVKNDVRDFFVAIRLILDGEFDQAQRYLFHAGWTPNDRSTRT